MLRKIKLYNGRYIALNTRLCEELDIVINDTVKYGDDCVIVIDGKEGSGKSNLTSWIKSYQLLLLV